jgi:hypothetical protein
MSRFSARAPNEFHLLERRSSASLALLSVRIEGTVVFVHWIIHGARDYKELL